MENSSLMLVKKIKSGGATHSLWDVLVHDIALTREDFARRIGYHRNTVSRWEEKLKAVPILYKQYWNGRPRSMYLDKYQIVVLLTLLMIKQEYRGHNVAGRLRQATFSLDKESVIKAIEVLNV